MPDEIDPEIAALIGGSVQEYTPSGRPPTGAGRGPGGADRGPGQAVPPPDFTTLFDDMGVTAEANERREGDVDLSRKSFAPIERIEAEKPATWFKDPTYYKTALNGEGDEAQKVHEVLGKLLKAADPKDKGVYRQQLIPAYWYLAAKVALKVATNQAPLPKRLMIRLSALLPNLFSPEMVDTFHKIIFERNTDEPIYYVDEWIRAVAVGQITQSATDEVKPRRQNGDDHARFQVMMQRVQGKRDSAEGIMKAKAEERRVLETALKERVELICEHGSHPGLLHVPSPYSESQKKTMSELNDIMRRMVAADKDLVASINDFDRANEELKSAAEKAASGGQETKTDFQTLAQEFETIRQMTKLCIGRQGNHFPLLSREYFHGNIKDIGTRENVIRLLAWIESIDCEAYCRPYKNTLHRIVPFIILLPCYGDSGICWEPFDRYNRATSRGRVALPMYPKNLTQAVITAVADLRWQVAKEKASYYWMEEGLTGNYYQWFTAKKIRGDVKEFFIQDYATWITKESEGIQKLEK
ncbi:MAG TPA: hypothetical protein VMC79_02470, partial [Rectinemataceae bacterium]|nr:hypothetical protein [Rectinemataceae bacterium]